MSDGGRVCVVCGCEARPLARFPLPGEPRVVALSGTVYRKGNGKAALSTWAAVRVCEGCLLCAFRPWRGLIRRHRLAWALLRSIKESYSSLLLEDSEG